MARDEMSVRLHLKRMKVLEVMVDDPFEFKVLVADTRPVVRCPSCGHKTAKVHDTRDVEVRDVEFGRRLEDHPEIEGSVTARLARSLERDARCMSIRQVCRRSGFSWHFVMGLVRAAAERALMHRRRMRCRVLLVEETSLRRRHRYVTMCLRRRVRSPAGHGARPGFPCPATTSGLLRPPVAEGGGGGGLRRFRGVQNCHPSNAAPGHPRHRQISRGQVAGRLPGRGTPALTAPGSQGHPPCLRPDVFRSRYLQLARFDHLGPEEAVELGRIPQANPELERAWRLAHLHGFYEAEDLAGAEQALSAFADTYAEAQPARVLQDRQRHLGLVFGDLRLPLRATNGRQEGLTNKIGVLKRVAYGFVNVHNLAARSLLLCPGVYL